MGIRIIVVVWLVCVVSVAPAYSRQPLVNADSTNPYTDIESYSRRSNFTKFLNRLIFHPAAFDSSRKKLKKRVSKKLIETSYSTFEGKIIRHINVSILDPFGYSITDTSLLPRYFVWKAGNTLHVKSQVTTIRNLLLIRKNQVFDSLLVKESERLVRSQGYVRDVLFYVTLSGRNQDSVDILIRELDKWTIIPRLSFSSSRIAVQLNDKNFAGFGHDFKNAFTWYHTTGDDAYIASYHVPNIRNTFVSTTLNYGTDEFRNFTSSFAVDRPFYSPFTKWAAGVYFTQQLRKDSIYRNDTLNVLQRFKFNGQDYWAGYSMQIFKGNSENNRTTNFVSAFRFLRIHFHSKPPAKIDTLKIYTDDEFYLAGVGISTRKYVQDKYIFNFGVKEDVPIGKVYGLTGGYQMRDLVARWYFGGRISFGDYYHFGYLSSSFECGTFFKNSKAEQGVISAGLIYFTGLLEIRKWKFRQFVKPRVILGINRLSYDSLTLNDGFGLDGFNSNTLSGTNRILLTFQTQAYAPWSIIGFRFGPYFICSLGMLGNQSTGFRNSKVYSHIGLGVLIKNDNLVLNTFQVSVAFYPLIPGKGQNIFKINSFKTSDFGLRDFEMGKPSAINFQ